VQKSSFGASDRISEAVFDARLALSANRASLREMGHIGESLGNLLIPQPYLRRKTQKRPDFTNLNVSEYRERPGSEIKEYQRKYEAKNHVREY